MAITKLSSQELYRKCDPQKFGFTTTADLEEILCVLGQDRAISAVELGINIRSRGYNLFCLGPEGTGKTSLVLLFSAYALAIFLITMLISIVIKKSRHLTTLIPIILLLTVICSFASNII